MLKIAICDDDKSYLELISFKIQKVIEAHIGLDYKILCFPSLDELYGQIKINKPDIVFLDIMLNEINTVNWLTEHQAELGKISFIVMTGFPTETENLSEIDCCYYLLKSKMTDEKLTRAIKRSLNSVTKETSDIKTISFGKNSYTIDYQTVLYIETQKNNLYIHCLDKKDITVYSTLKEFAKKLPPYFLHCHKCYVVNMNAIKGYKPHYFIMPDGAEIPIPSKKYKELISHYKKYIINI